MGTKKHLQKRIHVFRKVLFLLYLTIFFLDFTYLVAPQPEHVYPVTTVSSHAACVTTVS